ncbi:MAG: ankyrin repeat domain-containing protein, partial [Spirochaetales bacterium]|nr:ankyrin repeat domain-containing protein [Spirochaetales bacterium]
GMNPDVLYYDGRTLLQMAAGEGLLELAEILLAGGADLNNPDSRGWYPLMIAAAQDDGLEMVKLFVEAGADVNAAFDDDGTTVLALSAFNMNNPAITAYLLSMGADPLALNEDGHSALGYALAAEGLKEEIAQMLMDAGSPLTPFMFFGEPLTTAIMFDEPDKVRFLIDHFTPDELVQRGSSPLKTAVFHEASLELMEELLRLEGVVHLREGNKGVTPLMAAAEKGDTELVRLFLDNGAKPMARTIEGETALHFAASRGGSEEAVRVLMDLDSSLSVKGLRDLLHGNQELRGTELFWEVNDRVYNRN